MTRRRARRRGRRRRGRRLAIALVLLAGLGPLAVTAALRVVPPPTTAFMLQAGQAGAGGAVDYRWVALDAMAPAAAIAVIASEDQRFLEHRGFDVDAIRDALEESRAGGRTRGASTISQQVAKNLWLWPGRSLVRKGLEAYLTLGLEVLWDKRRILETYLNVAEFGPGIYGVGAASARFFDTSPAALRPEQAALLAAVLPSPRRWRVDRPSDYVRSRQAWILEQMPSVARRIPPDWFSAPATP